MSVSSGAAVRAEAAQLRLDRRFGEDGVARVAFRVDTGQAFIGALVARQPGGKLLLAGQLGSVSGSGQPSGQPVVARFTRYGRLDPSFGRNGRIRISFPGSPATSVSPPQPYMPFAPGTIVIQRDSRIVLGGSIGSCERLSCYVSPRRFAIVRLLSDGRLDGSFGADGFVERTPVKIGGDNVYGPFAQFGTLIVQPDGRLLLAGSAAHEFSMLGTRLLLTRFRADGSLDESFGVGGELRLPIDPEFMHWAPGPNGTLLRMAARNEGGIDAGGVRSGIDVFRIKADGSPDPSFGVGGVASLPGPHGYDFRVLASWPSGAVLVAGGPDASTLRPRIQLRRLSANGEPDPSFHHGCAHPDPARIGLLGATPFGAGALVTANRFTGPGAWVSRVLRYDANGCVDPSFPRIRLPGQLTTPTVDGRGRPLIAGFTKRTLTLLRIARPKTVPREAP